MGSPIVVWCKAASFNVDVESMSRTCVLRSVENGILKLEEVAEVFGFTRERARQLESKALERADLRSHGYKIFRELRDEGHEVFRPDLAETSTEMGAAEIKKSIQKIASTKRRDDGSWSTTYREGFAVKSTGRVLTGEEREQRIKELKARNNGSGSIEEASSMTVVTGKRDPQRGKDAMRLIEEFAATHNLPVVSAATRLGVAYSSFRQMKNGASCSQETFDRIVERSRAAAPPVEPAPVEPAPGGLTPGERAVCRAILKPTSVERTSVEPAPIEPASVEPAPQRNDERPSAPSDPIGEAIAALERVRAQSRLLARIGDVGHAERAVALVNELGGIEHAQRALAVIEQLGGIERAERIAGALGNK